MRRIIKTVLASALLLCLTGCSGKPDGPPAQKGGEAALDAAEAEALKEANAGASDLRKYIEIKETSEGEESSEAGTESPAASEAKEPEETETAEDTEAVGDGSTGPREYLKTEFAPEAVKGIYVSAWAMGTKKIREENFLSHMDGTELNTIVFDVKDDEGRVVFETDSPMVTEAGSVRMALADLPGMIGVLHDRGIYTIGRLVAFRDPYIRETKKEWVLKNPDGSVYTDDKGNSWIDPANEEACSYLLEVARDCAENGIDEIQFDYVRYPSAVTDEMAGRDGKGRQEAVLGFAKRCREEFEEIGIPFSLDVFGTVISSETDSDIIGQDYRNLTLAADAISPMVYPSHYADGSFGIKYPDMEPGETVYQSLMKSNHLLEGEHVNVRPWLQDFTADYLEHYRECGPEEVREQIEAVYKCGMTEWLIWDPSGHYSWDAFEKE